MVDIRVLDRHDDLLRAGQVFRTAMVGLPFPPIKPEDVAAIFEPGRAYGAFADGELVGTTDSYSGRLLAPGGTRLPQAAVTHVGVLPSHTRRGIATALAARQLEDARNRGEIVASLRASDARIYGHFGYGVANSSATFEVDKERARLRVGLADPGNVRLVDADGAWDLLAQIYARHQQGRPGVIDRSPYWWDLQKYKQSLSSAAAYFAVHGAAGQEDGFVRYHPVGLDSWFTSSQRTIVVDDIVAATPEAYVALVAYLLAIDLAHRIVFWSRPLDDALPLLFEDRRSVAITAVRDETWLRLLDVVAALDARTYGADETVVVDIADHLLPRNNGTIRLSAKGASATNEKAEASVDVSSLAAAYLGGTKWWQLAQAGRVKAQSPATIARLDALFAVPELPHSGTMF